MVTRSRFAGSRSRVQSVFHAISEPTRRRLLDELSGGARSAGALARKFPSSRPAVVRHLGVLRQAGLVHVRREGRRRIYRLTPAPLRAVGSWIDRYQAFWGERMNELARYLEAPAPAREERKE